MPPLCLRKICLLQAFIIYKCNGPLPLLSDWKSWVLVPAGLTTKGEFFPCRRGRALEMEEGAPKLQVVPGQAETPARHPG